MLNQNLKVKDKIVIWLSRQKPDTFFFYLFLVLLPTQIGVHFWPSWALVSGIRVDYLAPTIYLLDIVLLAMFVLALARKKLLFNFHPLVIVSSAIFICLNIFVSKSLPITAYKWLRFIELGILVLWVYQNKERILNFFTRPLIVGIGYSALIAVLQFLKGGTLGGIFYYLGERSFNIQTPGIALVNMFGKNYLRSYATFPHPNVLAGFSLVGFFLILVFEKDKRWKFWGSFLALLNVLVSFSDASVFTFIVCLLIYKLRLGSVLAKLYKQILTSILFISLLMMPLAQYLISLEIRFPENIANRLSLSVVAGRVFSMNPFLGVGLGNFISSIPKLGRAGSLWFLQPVHNIFELILVEVGAIGLVFFLILLGKLNVSKVNNNILLILPVLLTGMVDHYWITIHETAFLFSIVIAILL